MLKSMSLSLCFTLITLITFAQTKDEQSITRAVEKLKKAMVDADKNNLSALTSPKLTYGHSNGAIEDKKLFIENILNDKSDFVSIDLSEQTISISENIGLVRHKLDAVTNNDGKPGEAHLYVLLIWQKTGGQWKLLARQAVKQPIVAMPK